MKNENENSMIYADGTQVSGVYYTQPFTGTVESSRGLTVKPWGILYTVTLDSPIQLAWDALGSLRTRILVNDDELRIIN